MSGTRQYSVNTTDHILKYFLPSDSHTILVIPDQVGWQYSDWYPLTGASWGYEKSRFLTNILLYL